VTDDEAVDVLIIQPSFMAELVEHGKVAEGEHPIVARIGVELTSRPDMPLPDIATTKAFKQTLLNADTLIFNNVASGDYFARVRERGGDPYFGPTTGSCEHPDCLV
jgi:hypothetical protein